MSYIDFHAHVHLYEDPDACLSELERLDMLAVACSVDVPSYLATLRLAETCSRLIPTFGVHPSKASLYAGKLEDIDPFVRTSGLLGEIGLDGRWWKEVPANDQEKVFAWFLDKSVQYDKYVVIHTKDRERRVLEMLKHHQVEKAVIHWYHGPSGIFRQLLDRGYYQTFGCELRYSWLVRHFLKQTPAELILAETDNPGSERWLGGTLDGPALLCRVVGDIARIKRIRPDIARLLTVGNAMRLIRRG